MTTTPGPRLIDAAPRADVDGLVALARKLAEGLPTDPDGDCYFCGFGEDPDHQDNDPDCPVSKARALLAGDKAEAPHRE